MAKITKVYEVPDGPGCKGCDYLTKTSWALCPNEHTCSLFQMVLTTAREDVTATSPFSLDTRATTYIAKCSECRDSIEIESTKE